MHLTGRMGGEPRCVGPMFCQAGDVSGNLDAPPLKGSSLELGCGMHMLSILAKCNAFSGDVGYISVNTYLWDKNPCEVKGRDGNGRPRMSLPKPRICEKEGRKPGRKDVFPTWSMASPRATPGANCSRLCLAVPFYKSFLSPDLIIPNLSH